MWMWLAIGCNENFLFALRDNKDDPEEVEQEEDLDSDDSAQDDTNDSIEEAADEPVDTAEPSGEPSSEASVEPSSEPDDSGPIEQPGDSQSTPRRALFGEVIVNEVMIDPDSLQDKFGEWIELYNTTNDWLNLQQYRLRDQGVDDYEIQEVSSGSLVIPPEGFLVICAEPNYWDNGGITCQGSFLYQTFGGGFGLSNTEDEVILYSHSNQMIDRMTYTEGFAIPGSSLGLSPSYATESGNDDQNNWCEQGGFLPMGGYGSPGQINNTYLCF